MGAEIQKQNVKKREEMDSDEFTESEYSSEEESEFVQAKTSAPKRPKSTKHLEELKAKLGLDEFKDKAAAKREKRKRQKANKKLKKSGEDSTVKIIETQATKLNAKAAKIVPEIVTYLDPKKRNREKSEKTKEKQVEILEEVTMKQARFDVFKFGIKGFDKEGQHEARVALALKLGAKPEKKKCLPISELKEKRKQEKEEKQRQLELEKMTGMRKVSARPSSTKKSKKETEIPNKKRKKNEAEATPLKLGKFDGATLKLSQKDLLQIKKKR